VPKLALVGASAGAVIVAAVVAGVALEDREAKPGADPCIAVIDATEESADPLASAGLRGLAVSSRLVGAFPPRGLNCAGTITPSESRVRGVFVELGDGTGGTAAVYAAIHPRDESGDWRAYLRDMFEGDLDFHQRGDGSILAVIRGHPRSAEAVSAYEDVGRVTTLWRAVAPAR
jgi:hypothetical protein